MDGVGTVGSERAGLVTSRAAIVHAMDRNLEAVPDRPDEPPEPWGEDGDEPIARPTWWRWVAIAVVIAMVVATPFAYALYLLLS